MPFHVSLNNENKPFVDVMEHLYVALKIYLLQQTFTAILPCFNKMQQTHCL